MTRKKKSRKINVHGPRQQTRTEKGTGHEGKRKGAKGKAAGSRQNEGSAKSKLRVGRPQEPGDPRLGSKKPISLEAPQAEAPKAKPLSPEQELEKLENLPRLNALLDRLDREEVLSAEDQQWLDGKLDRIEQLMAQLGIEAEESEEQEQQTDPEQDLMRRFESGSDLLDDYKE
ncbi:GTPase-activating protein [Ferrimonas sediminicola]|uniref:Der GTPase-activating protein YihI n=1 Tax=Ferrimonas sediminicola TaxID=2569538 RepID=A0A4U1BI94_9GAMM|nr:Der GTPase-activating protein YihI [Ferrimonas sediminicola]TKB51049.1 GTPase-activating protein [Ferrimonas sediminicola]